MLRQELFRRMDESPDALFYEVPRLVTHIGDAAIAAVANSIGGTSRGRRPSSTSW